EAIETTRDFMQKYPEKSVEGMHLEGPFLNPEKKGAHSLSFIRKPTNSALERLLKAGDSVVKLMTIAPELFTEDQIKMLLDSGIVLSAGHSTLTSEQAK